jgi:hypothetical protein
MEWLTEIGKSVAASGPLAAVLGYAVLRLWNKLEEKDKALEACRKEMIERLLELAHRDDN